MAANHFYNVCFVGAGTVNFGFGDHPWNHSKRLEILGCVCIVAIVDPLTDKAKAILAGKQSGEHANLYKECHVYGKLQDALKNEKIDVAFVGLPPFGHGSGVSGLDVELQLLKNGIHVFIEKPVSVAEPEQFRSYVTAVEDAASKKGCVVSVGYMFRYHPAILRMKEELIEYGRPIIAMNARYSCTYSLLEKPFWWNKDQSGGPIIEQATHFCDLIRFFGDEVVLDSIQGVSVPLSSDSDSPGYLGSIPDEVKAANIPKEQQIPCGTQCTWRFERGGIGSLTHTVSLHGFKYESYIDIWCDGLRMSLRDPYTTDCTLGIRRSGNEQETIERFADADPYLGEDREFFDAIRTKSSSRVMSPYADAAKSYELTWAIRRATTAEKY